MGWRLLSAVLMMLVFWVGIMAAWFVKEARGRDRRPRKGGIMAKDPVCGMEVDEAKAAATSSYKGKTYYFCSPGCKKDFDSNPDKYAGRA
jgi:YHS domain-containing protein